MSNLKLTREQLRKIPVELRKELSSGASCLGDVILEYIAEAGGAISLDVLLVKYWEGTNTILTRYKMQEEVYKLVNKKFVSLNNLQKSVYFITKTGREEVMKNFKQQQDISS